MTAETVGGPCCAHMRVNYQTTMAEGLMRGWWECTDCGQKFLPAPAPTPQASKTKLTVERHDYDKLSQDERMAASDNGWGKECANYIRVTYNGQTLYLESDAIEPEDKTFGRDLNWIVDALRKVYELGLADGSRVETTARPLDEYHEDDGPVVWWKFPVNEPSWIGTPTDDSWPGYHTHWTPHPPLPASPRKTSCSNSNTGE